MKKLSIILILTLALSLFATPAFAVKPGGPQFIDWNLSADVMPVPPYGSFDIPGSDTASKLIVNQPNGKIEASITGSMKGLNPNTTYTVYLSNAYEPYVTGWNVEGSWRFRFDPSDPSDPSDYFIYDITITDQSAGTFSGNGGFAYPDDVLVSYTVTGTIDEITGTITLHADNFDTTDYYYDVIGTIASDGTISGTMDSSSGQHGLYYSTMGNAVETHSGDTGWPGFFTSTVPAFTFTTDEFGAGNWHLNLRDENFNGPGTYDLSVWINEAGKTILISDVFSAVVD